MAQISFNQFGKTTEIDIIGDIGESFFSDGHTLESVKAEFDRIDSTSLIINVASLGGFVSEGLAIHDLIRSFNGHTTAKIIGWTASMGTIVALGADRVEISENSHFLIHNAWTGVRGNARELQEVAKDLEKIDKRLINIYKKKTNRAEWDIAALMAEERWLSPEEAEQWGFVDHVMQQSKIAASFSSKELVQAGLPSIPENLNSKYNEMKENSIKEQFDSLKAWFVENFQNKATEAGEGEAFNHEEIQSKLAEFEKTANELEEKVSNHEAEVDAQNKAQKEAIEAINKEHEEALASKDAELKEASEKAAELQAKLDALNAGETVVKKDNEPEIGEKAKLNTGQSIIKDVLSTL